MDRRAPAGPTTAFSRTRRGAAAAEVEWLDFARGRGARPTATVSSVMSRTTHQRRIYRSGSAWCGARRGAVTVTTSGRVSS